MIHPFFSDFLLDRRQSDAMLNVRLDVTNQEELRAHVAEEDQQIAGKDAAGNGEAEDLNALYRGDIVASPQPPAGRGRGRGRAGFPHSPHAQVHPEFDANGGGDDGGGGERDDAAMAMDDDPHALGF